MTSGKLCLKRIEQKYCVKASKYWKSKLDTSNIIKLLSTSNLLLKKKFATEKWQQQQRTIGRVTLYSCRTGNSRNFHLLQFPRSVDSASTAASKTVSEGTGDKQDFSVNWRCCEAACSSASYCSLKWVRGERKVI